jgi:hypothetical protein
MVVLAATMLMYGGLTLVQGLLMIRDPRTVGQHTIRNVARTPAAEESVRKLEPILDGIVDRHRTALRIDAVAKIGFGLFMLYTVAAVLSRDRNGRRLALLTAVFGIAYQPRAAAVGVHREGDGRRRWPLLAEVMAVGRGGGRTQLSRWRHSKRRPGCSPWSGSVGACFCWCIGAGTAASCTASAAPAAGARAGRW